jgi:hypothetical protein
VKLFKQRGNQSSDLRDLEVNVGVSDMHVAKHGKVEEGGVVVTSAGKLPCKYVFHAGKCSVVHVVVSFELIQI